MTAAALIVGALIVGDALAVLSWVAAIEWERARNRRARHDA